MSDDIVHRLRDNWLSRAAVRNADYKDYPADLFDPKKYDYPPQTIPFRNHPGYLALHESQKQYIQSLAWIAWNKRVVDTEELLVAPALNAMMNGDTDISIKGTERIAIRHIMIDELFHSHMHEVAIDFTIRYREIPSHVIDKFQRPACSFRSYSETAASLKENWQKDTARLAWVVVGELSIYEFLTLVSKDPQMQPVSRNLIQLHERDEAAHASVIAQVMKNHFQELTEQQQACFIDCLPLAVTGFSQEDWVVWQDILELIEVEDAQQIIEDTINDINVPNRLPLLRSFEKIENFCRSLGFELPRANQSIKDRTPS